MPAHKYVEDNGSAAMLAAKKLAGVTSEVNLNEHAHLCQAWTRLPTRGDITTSPKQEYQWPHKKGLYPPKIEKCADDLINQTAVIASNEYK